jgi:hypothetical protein
MATVVRLQDGEGWTPRNVHQSVFALGTICYRLLASEQPASSAIQRACAEYAGKEALKGPARLARSCRATADSVRSAVGSVRPPANDRQAGEKRSRPRHRFEAAPKLCRR